jgi:hypothetical protein
MVCAVQFFDGALTCTFADRTVLIMTLAVIAGQVACPKSCRSSTP